MVYLFPWPREPRAVTVELGFAGPLGVGFGTLEATSPRVRVDVGSVAHHFPGLFTFSTPNWTLHNNTQSVHSKYQSKLIIVE